MDYLSLIMFTVATCGTPGPNNTMVLASGAVYGLRPSLPAVAGINTGFPIMVVIVGSGLGGLLKNSPIVYDVLRPIGAAYLIYLAYRIATAPVSDKQAKAAKPLSFIKTALFQFVNPKAWVMIVGAVVTYASVSHGYYLQVVEIALIFLVFGTPCTATWLLIGVSLKRVIAKPLQFRIFNVAMASLLVLSLIPVLGEIARELHRVT